MSSRKSNKSIETEVEQVTEEQVEYVSIASDEIANSEVFKKSPVVEEPVIEVDTEQAEVERLNRVNDLEKQIIQHQESIKQLRSELKKLEGKTKREGPTKMESCLALYNEIPA